MLISIVTTLYRSEAHIREFHERARCSVERITHDYEIILVNDGSPDRSLDRAIEVHLEDPRVRVIDLSRNFGHHKAIMAGLEAARGAFVFLIDSDLEEEPELLNHFYGELLESGVDVVFGVQERRKGGAFERLSGAAFYKLFNVMTQTKLPRNLVTARIMTRRYVDALLQFPEREFSIGGLWVLCGFAQKAILVQKRDTAQTSYSVARKLFVLVNAVTSFSSFPLVFIFFLGCVILVLSGLGAAAAVAQRFLTGSLEGWTSLIVTIWLFSGLIIFCLGVIGIYLAKIFTEIKQRPRTIVRAVYERAADPDDGAVSGAPEVVSTRS